MGKNLRTSFMDGPYLLPDHSNHFIYAQVLRIKGARHRQVWVQHPRVCVATRTK